MNKIIFSILLLTQFSFANKFEFSEEKYIDALNMNIKRTGYIIFLKDNLILKYDNEDKIIHFRKDNILLKEKQTEEILNYKDNIKLFIFYNLLQAIFTNNTTLLENNFTIIKTQEISLLPKEYINNVIKKISYKKLDNKLKYLNIYFVNKDRISIVQDK